VVNAVDNSNQFVDNLDADGLWKHCLKIIQENINPQSFQTWFKPLKPLTLESEALTLQVPSQFFYEWIEQHYPDTIRNALAQTAGDGLSLNYVIQKPDQEKKSFSPPPPMPHSGRFMGDQTYLNSRYIFQTFVEGNGNQFAKAAALAVAEKPGLTSFNPLVIYGGVGLQLEIIVCRTTQPRESDMSPVRNSLLSSSIPFRITERPNSVITIATLIYS